MKKKKGYPVLLGITVLFTLSSLILVILSQINSTSIGALSIDRKIIFILAPLMAAGMTCALRKRFFTED